MDVVLLNSRVRRVWFARGSSENQIGVSLRDTCLPLTAQSIVDDQRVDLGPIAHTGQTRSTELGTVRDDDRPIRSPHHASLGFDQEHVRVVEAFVVYPSYTEEGFLNVDSFKHLIGVRAVGHAGPIVDRPPENDQVDGIVRGEKIRDWEGVRDDLQRPPDQLLREFIRGASPVEQQRVVIVDQSGGGDGDRSLLIPSSILRAGTLKLADGGNRTGEEDPSMRPLCFACFFERFEIPADCRFAYFHGIAQVGDGYEPMLANQIAQFRSSCGGSLQGSVR